MAAQSPLLSELCNTCHKSTPKYRCPGCSARTCSLPCYKLHQQRAVCDGQRDATKFVKKSQLETAAGIDHDFNFLSGIERGLDGSEKNLDERGVGTRDGKRMHLKNYDSFRKRIEETQVIVEKAPVGLSRQKANKSRWNPRTKGILWTVEWLHDDQSKDIRDLHDTRPLCEAYEEQFRNRRTLKRKRDTDGAGQTQSTSPVHVDKDQSSDGQSPSTQAPPHSAPTHESDASPESSSVPLVSASQQPGPGLEDQEIKVDSRTKEPAESKMPHAQQPRPSPDTPSESPTAFETHWHFYLLKPHTYGKQRVLVPLQPTDTLLLALRQQIVLEFPTIVVLVQPANNLPDGFIADTAYHEMLSGERKKLDTQLASEGLADIDFEARAAVEDNSSDRVDEAKLMEVLSKDFEP